MAREKPAARRQKRQAVKAEDHAQECQRRQPTQPKTSRQRQYLKSLKSNAITVATGPAGTGKTYVAMSHAADLLMAEQIDNVVICRPAVPVGERHGFLPGKIEAKMAPWAKPAVQVLQKRLGAAKFSALVQEGRIVIQSFEHIQGLTLENAFVLLDEAENTTKAQMRMFLTRMGENVTVCLDGDIRQKQIDVESGLEQFLRMVRTQFLPFGHIEFTRRDVVRSGTCRIVLDAYAAEDGEDLDDFEDEDEGLRRICA